MHSMRSINGMLEGTALPRLNMSEMEALFERDSLSLLARVELQEELVVQPIELPPMCGASGR
jgi:hypothetical protein